MKNYLLPEDVRSAMLAYFLDRPYKEVAKGVQMLEGLKEAPAAAPTLEVVPDAIDKDKEG